MRVLALAAALSLVLGGGVVRAQAPEGPGQAPAPAPARPVFLEGVKYGFVNLQLAFVQSAEGQRVQKLFETRQGEIGERDKALQAARQRAQTQASVLSDEARVKLQTDLDRQQRDFERYVSDAEEEVQRAQQQAEVEFQKRFAPVIERIAREKQLQLVFRETALVWADAGVDLTPEVVEQLGGAPSAAAAPAPASPPAASGAR